MNAPDGPVYYRAALNFNHSESWTDVGVEARTNRGDAFGQPATESTHPHPMALHVPSNAMRQDNIRPLGYCPIPPTLAPKETRQA
jgi:hypothetical protein